MTTIKGKGQLSAHIIKRYIPCTPESKLGYIAPRTICNGGQIVYKDTINARLSFPEINLFGLSSKRMVSMAARSVILLKNGTRHTNSIISQRLFILEKKNLVPH